MTKKLSLILGSLLFALVLAGCSSTPPAEEAPVEEVVVEETLPAEDGTLVGEEIITEETYVGEEVGEDAGTEEVQVVENEL